MAWQSGWTFYPADAKKSVIHEEPHFTNPISRTSRSYGPTSSTRSRPGAKPISDIEEIHRSTTISLLGMLSLKLGRSVEWDAENELIRGDAEANKLLKSRVSWHLEVSGLKSKCSRRRNGVRRSTRIPSPGRSPS